MLLCDGGVVEVTEKVCYKPKKILVVVYTYLLDDYWFLVI